MQELTTFIENHASLTIAALILLILVTIVEFLRAKRRIASLSPTQMVQVINHQQGVVIDIRSNELYKNGHIIAAVSIPHVDLQKSVKKLEKFKNKPLLIVCNTGIESQKIAAQLTKQGYNANALSGGLRAWTDASLPLVKE